MFFWKVERGTFHFAKRGSFHFALTDNSYKVYDSIIKENGVGTLKNTRNLNTTLKRFFLDSISLPL